MYISFKMRKDKISMFYTDLEDTSEFVLYDNTSVMHGFYKRNSLPEHYRITITSVVVILILFTTLGNLATVVAVRKDRRLRSVSNFYIASLAVADLIVGMFVMTFMLLYTITFDGVWVFGRAFCDIWNFVDYVSCTASLTNVCVIAVDRFQTVSQPLKSIRKRTTRRAMKMISIAWLLPALFWLVVIVGLRLINGHPPEGHCYIKWWPDYTALLAACISVYIPIILTMVLFFTIMSTLKRHMSAMSDQMLRSGSVRLDDNGDAVEDYQTHCEPNCQESHCLPDCQQPQCLAHTQPQMQPCQVSAMDATGVVTTYTNHQVTMIRIHQNTMADIVEMDGSLPRGLLVSEACQTGEDEVFMAQNGTELRSVGTSTSPERYGLVRNVCTNTSPSLAKRPPFDATDTTTGTKRDRASYSSVNTLASDSHSESDYEGHNQSSGSESTASRDLLSDSDLPMTPYPPWRRRYASLLRERRESTVERSRFRQQWRAAKTLGLIMLFLLLCWLPFAIMWPLKTFCPQCVRQRIFDISVWTNYLNSSINPFIYCIYNPHFRRAYKKILMRR